MWGYVGSRGPWLVPSNLMSLRASRLTESPQAWDGSRAELAGSHSGLARWARRGLPGGGCAGLVEGSQGASCALSMHISPVGP